MPRLSYPCTNWPMGNIHQFYWVMGWKKKKRKKLQCFGVNSVQRKFYKARKDTFFGACLNGTMYSSIHLPSTAECIPQGGKPGIGCFLCFLLSVTWSWLLPPPPRLSSLDFYTFCLFCQYPGWKVVPQKMALLLGWFVTPFHRRQDNLNHLFIQFCLLQTLQLQ